MKLRFLFVVTLCFFSAAMLNAQVTFYSCTGTASLEITNPINQKVYNLSLSQSPYPLQVWVSYYPGATIAQRRFKFSNGDFDYNMYYTSAFSYVSGDFPVISPTPGTHTWTVTSYWLNELSGNWVQETSTSVTFIIQPTLTVYNSFGSGNVIINDTVRSSGYSFNPTPNSTVYLTAINNQSYNDYVRNFVKWSLYSGLMPTTLSTSVSSPSDAHKTCTAVFNRVINVALSTSLGSGAISYNGSSVTTPCTVNLIESDSATVTAPGSIERESMIYVFSGWSDGNTSASRKLKNITSHLSLTANYTLSRPGNSYRNQNNSTTVGQPITISWSEHPNTGVTAYQVWRRVKDVQSNTLLATVNRGTTSYTDSECTYTSGYSDNLIYYDIRAYYSPNGTYADADFVAVFGDYTASGSNPDASAVSSGSSSKTSSSVTVPTEYKISNYPNPFNPTTVIQYTMPEAGQVVLKIYNMIGQEVKTLVNQLESAGVHTVNFNASGLPTGIYIARIQAGSKVISHKLQLVK